MAFPFQFPLLDIPRARETTMLYVSCSRSDLIPPILNRSQDATMLHVSCLPANLFRSNTSVPLSVHSKQQGDDDAVRKLFPRKEVARTFSAPDLTCFGPKITQLALFLLLYF